MRRMIGAVGVVMVVSFLLSAAPAPRSPLSVPQKLAQRVKFDGFEDAKTTLEDALAKLGKLHEIDFEINDKAFQAEELQNVRQAEIAQPTPLRPARNIRLSALLKRVLARVPVPSGATYTVRADHVEITTAAAQAAEIWGTYRGPHLPLVNATLEKCSLEDALQELSEQTEFNIVLDRRVGEKGKTVVSARLRNTPLDTALRLLADMAELRALHVDNVLYVTSPENAAAMEARIDKEQLPKNPLDDQAEGEPGWFQKIRRGSGPGTRVVPAPKAGGA